MRPLEIDSCDEFEGVALEITATYRRKLSGLRYMSRRERVQAIRAARDWRAGAMKALREKRTYARAARRAMREAQRPAPP